MARCRANLLQKTRIHRGAAGAPNGRCHETRRTISTLLVLLLAASLGALAAESNSRWGIHDISETEDELPDGRTAVVIQHYQVIHADNPADPFYNVGADCSGKLIMSQDGQPMSGSGVGLTKDAGGDGASLWWRVTEAGMPKGPGLGGEYGIYEGYGKYEGVKGGGTWQRTHVFEGGAAGRAKGTFSMK